MQPEAVKMNIIDASVATRRQLLNDAVIQLKKEFIGIDGIIDEVVDSMLPWWLFPHHQIRPLIINLWGMTGSGKTALIKRLTDLISYQNFLMRFDMGEFSPTGSALKYTLTRQLNQFHEGAPIILLDEFQFAKTKDEAAKEVNNSNLRIIWDLLDSGQLIYEPDGMNYYATRAKKVIALLKALDKQGAKIENGIVTNRAQEVHENLVNYQFGYCDGTIDRTANPNPFKPEEMLISDIFCTGIYEINQNNFMNWKEVADEIKGMTSLIELVDFIAILFEKEMSFKTMDLSKSLIFVVGNLDEAYVMSNNINPDIDADEFRRYTQKITIADIKKALQSRFRNEQIARLGNTHLIYHAFSHANFAELIDMHLTNLAKLVQEKFGMQVSFSDSVHKLIYAEGVFPTQGVRPVVSTIRNMIESNVAKIILHREQFAPKSDRIQWDFSEDKYAIEFFTKTKSVGKLDIPALQKINSLRKSTQNDLQAMVAVHEAGHAIAAMFMMRIVPEYVITKTVDTDSQGFTYTIAPEEVTTYRLLMDRLRVLLGGYVAESAVFGRDNNTTGVSHDLQQVSMIAQQILREYGMYSVPAKFNIHSYGGLVYQFTFSPEMEERAKQIILTCLAEVEACIKEHRTLLLDIAWHLSNNSRIDKPELETMCAAYLKKRKLKPVEFYTKDTYYNFREQLIAARLL
jgi:Peptidase family M41/C-terminal, D2-small domain, of ClpB protein